MIKTVGIVTNVQSPLAKRGAQSLSTWLSDQGLSFLIDSESAKVADIPGSISKKELIEQSDLLVVLGGDGTFLSVGRMMEGNSAPILGINLGGLGFLTEFTFDEMIPALEKALEGDYVCEDRIMMDISILREGKEISKYTVLNDIVITRAAPSPMIKLRVVAGGVFVNDYVADGLIISTPTGSTAYNLSSGGPIIYPTLNAFIINPICPHTLTNRPLVIPDDVAVELSLTPGYLGQAVATLDGQVGYQLNVRDKIVATKSKDIARIIQSPNNNYYELLREKLNWGGDIRNETRR